jgi:hypothetical protein
MHETATDLLASGGAVPPKTKRKLLVDISRTGHSTGWAQGDYIFVKARKAYLQRHDIQ